MNIGFNSMGFFSSTASTGAVNSKGPAVSLKGNGVKEGDFKNILLAQNQGEYGSQDETVENVLPDEALEKLNKLLEMEPEELAEVLQGLEPEFLMALKALLDIPADSLAQYLVSLDPELDSSSLQALEESLQRLKDALVQELTGTNPEQLLAEEGETVLEKGQGDSEAGNSNAVGVNSSNQGDGGSVSSELSADSSTTVKTANNGIASVFSEDRKGFQQSEEKSVSLEELAADRGKQGSRDDLSVLEDGKGQKNAQSDQGQSAEKLNSLARENAGFTLGKTGDVAGQGKENDFWKTNQLDSAAQNSTSISSKEQLAQNGQFSDLMGQTSQQGSGLNGANAAGTAETARVNLQNVIEQITDRIQFSQQGNKQLNIQLEPESLGKVRVQLKVEAGEVMARLLVESQEVKSYLEHNINGLRSNLVRQGLTVDQLYVESNDKYFNEEFDSQQGSYQEQQHSNQEQNSQDFGQISYEEMETLLSEEGFSELPQSIIADHRWSNLNYIRHRMNLLA
ncbi:hypothetical protein GM661_02695 [Iocasia frigidifontis]|uniref:Flagellar hook-length control protein-like C-terminal domain-containing protein n=1 Tax=Iocasia fonsfrigidae TaxID=2682810 RepID=A0A8A7K6H2_9FIRM|nr:flagellar hook-length control protein FliK [Iocasia fonsfrigidae]QTL96961.1 hypothetical protein GM661_02695 [Iocasia fonsfrigidae]